MAREHYGRELWDRLTEYVSHDDNLPVTELGWWTGDKLFHLCHYLALTTHAMKDNPSFSGLVYVDPFCGTGVCVARRVESAQRFPGSGLLAAGCKKPFDHMFLSDINAAAVQAIESRIQGLHAETRLSCSVGDANCVLREISSQIPDRALTIAFIDPYALGIEFTAIKLLVEHRRVDLIILFPDAVDIVRNVESVYLPRKSDKLDRVLGLDYDWRPSYKALQVRHGAAVRDFFVDQYLQRIAELRYAHTSQKIIRSAKGPIYRLVYASRSDLGLKFWDIAADEDLDGTRTLFGP